MKSISLLLIPILCAALGGGSSLAQAPAESQYPAAAPPAYLPGSGPVVLEWVPPALAQLSAQAAVKSSFTLDRALLGMASGLISDSDQELRHAVNKLDGVSVHLLRFGAEGMADPAAINAIRQSYHLRGWKHLVSTTNSGGPLHNETTDVWLVLDGANLRGAVVLAETPKSLTLVTIAGNLSPADLLHLRGHFGIPRFADDSLKSAQIQ